MLYIGSKHDPQEAERCDHIVEIVLEWIRHRLSHIGKRGKMHDHVDSIVPKNAAYGILVPEIVAMEAYRGGQCLGMPEYEVVQYDGPMPCDEQLADTVTSDVTRASDNKNIHGFW